MRVPPSSPLTGQIAPCFAPLPGCLRQHNPCISSASWNHHLSFIRLSSLWSSDLASRSRAWFSGDAHPKYTTFPNILHSQIYYIPKYTTFPNILHSQIYYIPKYTTFPNILHSQIYYIPKYTTFPNILHSQIYYIPKYTTFPNILHSFI